MMRMSRICAYGRFGQGTILVILTNEKYLIICIPCDIILYVIEPVCGSNRISWSDIEVVITGLTRNQVDLTVSWVRIPLAPPEKGLRMRSLFVCGAVGFEEAQK